ncbi:hypothetical protein ABIF68_010977 [Bradyrhizobium japonicum]
MQRQALDPVLKQISRRTDPYALETLARALQALPCKLTKGQARQALDAVLKQIGEMNTDWTLRTLAQALGALAGVNRRLTGTPYRPPKGTPLIGVLCW